MMRMQSLVALCFQLQRLNGKKPFFLDCRKVAELLRLKNHGTAHNWLMALCREHGGEAILRKVTSGSFATRRANEYLYVPLIQSGKMGTSIDSAARTELEAKIRDIASDLIGVESELIGMQDDLFGLGLNSIMVVKLISRLKNDLKLNISIPTVFVYPTIAELVACPEVASRGSIFRVDK